MKYLTILITILFSYVCYSQNTVISVGSSWKYHDQGDVGTTNWVNNNFDDSAWASGNAELGYGDGDEATVVSFGGNSSNKHITTYFRKTINFSEARGLNCQIKMDDGAVVYLNGIEIYRNGMPAGSISFSTTANSTIDENAWYTFTIPMNLTLVGQNTFAVEIHQASPSSSDISFDFEAILQPTTPPAPTTGVYINELMASNSETATDQISESSDWIEIFNNTSNALDLNGYYFTDDSTETDKFQITGSLSVPAFGRKIIWASGEPTRGVDHLGFSLSADGEFVALIQPDGTTILDSVSFSKQRTDVSFGRETDGSANLRFFSPASFNATNNSANAYLGILEPPTFSHESGFYQNSFNLSLSSENQSTIYYSTDSSIPSPSNLTPQSYSYKNSFPYDPNSSPGPFLSRTYRSYQYSSGLFITDPVNEPNYVSQISSTYNANAGYLPNYATEKCRVISAIAHKAGYLSSITVSKSYFFSNSSSNPFSLPIVSLSIQEDLLFDYFDGIMTAGGNFDFWRSTFPSAQTNVYSWANYLLRGRSYEKQGYLSILKSNSDIYGQSIGVRIHGGTSRAQSQKSLRIYARTTYEKDKFEYPLFDELPYNSYKTFMIYSGGQDRLTYLKDMSIHKINSHLNFDTQAATPSLFFLNGEFWGMYALRERYDNYYFARTYNVDENNLDISEVVPPNNSSMIEGDASHINNLRAFLLVNNLGQSANYEYVITQLDEKNCADYYIANIFFGNLDWTGGNNRGLWRERNVYNPNAPKGRDGRWRWYMYDIDSGMSIDFLNNNNLFAALNGSSDFEENLFIRKLLENSGYKNYFINRFSDLLNTSLNYSYTSSIINANKQILAADIQKQLDRWAYPPSKSFWENFIGDVLSYASQRPSIQKNHLRFQFSLSGDYNLTVDVSDEVAGYIHVNSIDIIPSTPGINQNPYPWTGEYFANIPLKIHARPNVGYKFKHWEYNGTTLTDSVLTINTSSSVSYKAIFEEDLLSENPLPLAFDVDKCGYQFKFWDEDANDGTFPVSMAFVYMDEEDPTLSANIAGFTSGDYNNNSRTRVNGLNGNGVSFINTGSERDGYPATKVGGAIMSLRTIGYDSLKLSFTAGTITSNSREYNLRLQYRIGDKLPFTDLLDDNNQIVEYTRSPISGEEQQFEVKLPDTILDKPFVQLFWRYYYTGTRNSEASGARDEIRLDDVKIQAKLLIDQPVTVSAIYDKYGEITAGSSIDSNTNLTLEAGSFILLKPGFATSNQTVFAATVTGCPE